MGGTMEASFSLPEIKKLYFLIKKKDFIRGTTNVFIPIKSKKQQKLLHQI